MKKALKRFGRNAFSLLIVGAVTVYKNDPRYLVLVPLITAFCKYLRDEFGIKYLPF